MAKCTQCGVAGRTSVIRSHRQKCTVPQGKEHEGGGNVAELVLEKLDDPVTFFQMVLKTLWTILFPFGTSPKYLLLTFFVLWPVSFNIANKYFLAPAIMLGKNALSFGKSLQSFYKFLGVVDVDDEDEQTLFGLLSDMSAFVKTGLLQSVPQSKLTIAKKTLLEVKELQKEIKEGLNLFNQEKSPEDADVDYF